MRDAYTLKIRRLVRCDPRLGRNVVHDSTSRRYAFAARRDPRELQSKRHAMHLPILDQANEGSCTGHGATANIGGDAFWAAAREVVSTDAQEAHLYARGLYSQATTLDPWEGQFEPDDTGSDGLSVAKALQQRGLISGYQHAFSLEATLNALAARPVIVGTSWLRDMFEPGADGRIAVSGAVDGGHEYCLDELDVENRRAWIRQSWGARWGQGGRAWMTWDDLGRLLADDGDCTVLVPLSEPAPQPSPAPEPTAAPAPQPAPLLPEDGALAEALDRFIDTAQCPAYVRRKTLDWLAVRRPAGANGKP